MTDSTHFDRWGAQYDQDELHPRIVSLLLDGVTIGEGCRVLDIATGTGHVALRAARLVGPTGDVVGIDISEGMLAEARRKAEAARLGNMRFVRADAERIEFAAESFDFVLCSSALVLMTDIGAALKRWRNFLKPGGILAFDTPAKPFGISDYAVEAAARHGVHLSYGDAADTADKCRDLLQAAKLEPVSIRSVVAGSRLLPLDEAVALYDDRVDHPAWRGIKDAPAAKRADIRADYIESITAASADRHIADDTALNFSVGLRPVLP